MTNPIIDGIQFIYLICIISGMLTLGWIYFFSAVRKNKESVRDLITGSSFLQNLTVIGVVLTIGVLALIGVVKGELAATLLSGVVGYVLGSIRIYDKPK